MGCITSLHYSNLKAAAIDNSAMTGIDPCIVLRRPLQQPTWQATIMGNRNDTVLVSRAAKSPSSIRPLGPYCSSTANTITGRLGRHDQHLVEVVGTLSHSLLPQDISTQCFTGAIWNENDTQNVLASH